MLSSPPPWPLHTRRRLLVAISGGVAFILFRALSHAPGLVEAVYGRHLGPLIARSLSRASGLLPFSSFEILGLAYVGVLAIAATRALAAVSRGHRELRNALTGGILRLTRDAGVVVLLFYGLWGLNYARRPLESRLGWPQWNPPGDRFVEALAAEAVAASNAAYLEIHGVEDAGEPTPMPEEAVELDRALEEGWRRAVPLFELPASVGLTYGPVKPLMLSPITARFGISGFYSPFTGEANVLANSPAISRCRSMAHEKAHQRGIGPESEASFLGFVTAALAPHPLARYCAFTAAQGQLIAALALSNTDAARRISSDRYPGVDRDLRDAATYWQRLRGVTTTIGRTVNDRYLRAQSVEGGVHSYSLTVRLLITFAGQHGGSIVPSPPTNERLADPGANAES